MDEADVTGDRMAQEIDFLRRQNEAKAKQREVVPCGLCYNCDEPVTDKKLFCDADCSKDWEKFNVLSRN